MNKRRISEAEADLLAMKLRRENIVSQHKAAMEEFKFKDMIKAGERLGIILMSLGRYMQIMPDYPRPFKEKSFHDYVSWPKKSSKSGSDIHLIFQMK